ncbi:hypothetical protein M427DRAFT_37609 [Gonapodya prolifera JEL478]|uniref:Uncharacterized protein n=1 Tax=Gonapodya prolifera (strain JEL478) TaxID=1344416 RepID=A0A139A0C9_GONPJ|nr:hypothetical protein M427DRAFT_37609 [Gonapodya prolifera JEL478]|eukprot:KXS10237.1 hypothetical protein M427DRAFT_37609 [Gonapodya prolifera JEL478]
MPNLSRHPPNPRGRSCAHFPARTYSTPSASTPGFSSEGWAATENREDLARAGNVSAGTRPWQSLSSGSGSFLLRMATWLPPGSGDRYAGHQSQPHLYDRNTSIQDPAAGAVVVDMDAEVQGGENAEGTESTPFAAPTTTTADDAVSCRSPVLGDIHDRPVHTPPDSTSLSPASSPQPDSDDERDLGVRLAVDRDRDLERS